MPNEDTRPAPSSATPTRLGVFCECLAIIETLAPPDREAVAGALGDFRWSAMLKVPVDWKARSGKWKAKAEELQLELDEYDIDGGAADS